MSTSQLLVLDLVVAIAVTAAWVGAGIAAAVGRARVSLLVLGMAAAATLGRVGLVAALSGRGWWFVQEKVTLTLPLLAVAGSVAVVVAGPRLARAGWPRPSAAAPGIPRGAVVALLTAGYAAAVGIGVTMLVGYPATVGVALVATATVALAGLVTWRATGPLAGRIGAPMLTSATAAALVVALAGVGLGFLPAGADTGGGPAQAEAAQAVPVTSLRGPQTPADGAEVRRYTLTAQQATVSLSSGGTVQAWTFDGQVPGPTITATQGDLIEVTLRNQDIEEGVTLHWHGYEVPAGEDGAAGLTQSPVDPGEELVYRFRADQVGTFWYHTHHVSHEGVRRGLFGALIVHPTESPAFEYDLTYAVHAFDGVTVLNDHDETLVQSVTPEAAVRLRLINTGDLPRRITVAGAAFRLVAVDGRDLQAPEEVTEVALRLPGGGRYDVELTMPRSAVALTVDGAPEPSLRLAPGTDTMDASDAAEVTDTTGWPELDLLHYGSGGSTPFDAGSEFDRDFTLVLDRGVAMVDGMPRYAQTINGRGHPSVPDQVVTEGDLVRFTVVNRSQETHPWHLHGHTVLVLERDGQSPTGSPLWLDTFDVRPGEVWKVAFYADNPGLWMNHCHNLAHAAEGMMLHLRYEKVTSHAHKGQ